MPENVMFWYTESVDAVKIGHNDNGLTNTGLTKEYKLGDYSFPAIFDTGTSLIYTPAQIGEEIISRLIHKKIFAQDISTGLIVVDCSQKD